MTAIIDKIRKNVKIIPTIGILLYYLAFLFRITAANGTVLAHISNLMMTIIGFTSLFIFFLRAIKEKRLTFWIASKEMIILFVLFFLGIVSANVNSNVSFLGIIMSLQIIGLSYIFLTYQLDYKLVRISYYIHVSFFLFVILMGIHPNDVFESASQNIVSVVLIAQCVLFYISCLQNQKKIEIVPAILTFLLCLWALGRGGILISFIFLLGIIYFRLRERGASIKGQKLRAKLVGQRKRILIVLGLLVFVLLLLIFVLSVVFEEALQRFINEGFTEPGRLMAIQEYFIRMFDSPSNFFWGVTIEGNDVFAIPMLRYSLHNSLLYVHATRGLFGVIIITLLLLKSSIDSFKHKKYFRLFLMIVILLRMAIDTIAFVGNGIYEPLLYVFLFNKTFEK